MNYLLMLLLALPGISHPAWAANLDAPPGKLAPLAAPALGQTWFSSQFLAITNYNLDDIGVTDVNRDDHLDIFTTNHSSRPGIFLGDRLGGFSDNRLSNFLLDHDPAFPSIENAYSGPLMDSPGLYVYWKRERLNISTPSGGDPLEITGTFTILSPVTIETKSNSVTVALTESQLPEGAVQTVVTFQVAPGKMGYLTLLPRFLEVPVAFHITPTLPVNRIFIGADKVSPPASDFTTTLTDRHSMAWADYDGDDQVDVFITRGGQKGELSQFPDIFSHELFLNVGGQFQNTIASSGIQIDNNRPRRATWIDFDRDGRLDLYLRSEATPAQLFRHTETGSFVDVAPALGLNLVATGSPVWLDADLDGNPDLLLTCGKEILLFLNHGTTFERKLLGVRTGGLYENFKICDYDQDGDLDVLLVSRQSNILLINEAGTFRVVAPQTIGLPVTALAGNFVDFNNDGLADFYAVPHGLFRQRQDHTFIKTGILAMANPATVTDAISTWFDADNDGAMDLLLSYSIDPLFSRFYWKTKLIHNVGAVNNWLEVNLVGPSGNRQAIGARVQVTAGGKTQSQRLGSFEGSRYSQGHYRLYFGLGKNPLVDSLNIVWPDGKSHQLDAVPANQITTISYDDLN